MSRGVLGFTLVLLCTASLSCGEDGVPIELPSEPTGHPATGSPDAGATSDASTSTSSAEQICVDKINAYRATLGLPAYARWSAEEGCANGQAKSDSATSAAHGAFGMCTEMAQNECPGWDGPAQTMIPSCLAAMWSEGPGGGHYENMTGNYTKVACGFYTLPNGSVWAVQNFR
jgi:hypothetical protein